MVTEYINPPQTLLFGNFCINQTGSNSNTFLFSFSHNMRPQIIRMVSALLSEKNYKVFNLKPLFIELGKYILFCLPFSLKNYPTQQWKIVCLHHDHFLSYN